MNTSRRENKFEFLSSSFSSENEETKKSSTSKPKKTKSEIKKSKLTGKRNDPDYKTVGVLLPISLHKKAKFLLMKNDDERNFSELITELLENWVNKDSV